MPAVGEAVRQSAVPREELFLTSKIWISNHGYERARAAIAALDQQTSAFFNHQDPGTVELLANLVRNV